MDNSLLNSVNRVASKMYSNLKSLVGLYNTSRNEIVNDVYNMFVRDKHFNTIFEYYRLCNNPLKRLTVIRHGDSNTTDEITIYPGEINNGYLISDISNNIGEFEYRNDEGADEKKTIRYTSTKKFKLNLGILSEVITYGNIDVIEKDLFVNCTLPNTSQQNAWEQNFTEFDRSSRSLIFNKYPVFTNFIAQLIQFARDNVEEDVTDIRMARTIVKYRYIDHDKDVYTDDKGIRKPNSAINLRDNIIDHILEDISNAVNARIEGNGTGIKLSSDRSPQYSAEGSFVYNRPFKLNVSIQSTIIDDGNDSPFDVFLSNFAKDTNKTYRI